MERGVYEAEASWSLSVSGLLFGSDAQWWRSAVAALRSVMKRSMSD